MLQRGVTNQDRVKERAKVVIRVMTECKMTQSALATAMASAEVPGGSRGPGR